MGAATGSIGPATSSRTPPGPPGRTCDAGGGDRGGGRPRGGTACRRRAAVGDAELGPEDLADLLGAGRADAVGRGASHAAGRRRGSASSRPRNRSGRPEAGGHSPALRGGSTAPRAGAAGTTPTLGRLPCRGRRPFEGRLAEGPTEWGRTVRRDSPGPRVDAGGKPSSHPSASILRRRPAPSGGSSP
jgi:hypothetical protein